MNSQYSEGDEVEFLRQRVQQLEVIMLEYLRLEQLIDQATQDHLTPYGNTRVLSRERLSTFLPRSRTHLANNIIYVDPTTQRIVDINKMALEFMGYTRDELMGRLITDLEIPGEGANVVLRTYVESSIEEQVYQALYRHRSGQHLFVHVYKRLLYKGEQSVLHYRLDDQSLYGRLWKELKRREHYGSAFQKKLRALNKATIELSRIQDFDALCLQAVKFATEELGFDRLGIWFLEREKKRMTGAYGVDEKGAIRAEHDQSWSYSDTYIEDFLAGHTDIVFAYDESPIYNDRSEIIDYGWHISVPMLADGELLGVLTADNYLHKQSIDDYEPELLRLYGMTVGYLVHLAKH